MGENDPMASLMTIGDFSQATQLSAKSLRFYHRVGILEPAEIDPHNGYRLYASGQVSDARVIREFRALDLPLDSIREILATADVAGRNALITEHLNRLEERLRVTQHAVASLRGLVDPGSTPPHIEHRSVPALPALVIRERINRDDLGDWYTAARDELLAIDPADIAGPLGGEWAAELFLDGRGEAVLFLPLREGAAEHEYPGRLRLEVLPAVELAVAVHQGPDETIAETYAALGVYVAEHELGVPGPLRERYLRAATDESPELVTEIGWPIFRTGR